MDIFNCCTSRAAESSKDRRPANGTAGNGPGSNNQLSGRGGSAVRPAYNAQGGGAGDGPSLRLTCFNQNDEEIRQVVIRRSMAWRDMQGLVTDILGQPAMVAYDNGVGVDLSINTEQDWEQFLSMLERETILNREYDILLLPKGSWQQYQSKQQAL